MVDQYELADTHTHELLSHWRSEATTSDDRHRESPDPILNKAKRITLACIQGGVEGGVHGAEESPGTSSGIF